MKNRKKEILALSIIIIIQTIIFIVTGALKTYIHMDEAYSLGLASYDKVEIQANDDFYNEWHNGEYYEDYLAVNDDEVGEYKQVYENQKNDVHPPLYYLLLRVAMGFSINHYSKWSGIILNMIIWAFVTIFTYLILEKIIKSKKKAVVLTFISGITMASLTNVIYIRMYAFSTLNILITTYLHMKLQDNEKINIKLLIFIGISALIGSLTHYYYLFYLAMLYIIFGIKYIRQKKYKNLISYTVTMAVAGVLSLIIFPYSIQHMFFGYRGQGVISNLTNVPQFLISLCQYIFKLNFFAFNNIMFLILLIVIGIIIYKLFKKQKINSEKNEYIKIILLPTLFYFVLVSVASPWIELRYIMPICNLAFILVLYYFYQIVKNICNEKKADIVMIITLVTMLILPAVFKIEPEVMFSDKREIVQKLSSEWNVPTIYFFCSEHNRFLDDIYLFSLVNESYIAKDMEYNIENMQKLLDGKDISNGVIVFINEGQQNDDILAILTEATSIDSCTWVKRLNACDVYYCRNQNDTQDT